MIAFDIETGPLPEEEIIDLFDPDAVKLGNLKDPDKIEAKIEKAREEFMERAALSAVTGQVLAIGCKGVKVDLLYQTDSISERAVLLTWWKFVSEGDDPCSLVGHYIYNFDLPFLVRRSWLLGVDVPDWVITQDRFWHTRFKDTAKVWALGVYGEYIKLEAIDRALGGPGKPADTTGADFARLFNGTPEEREEALAYLENDLDMTWRVANALQVL